jgi:hypothetical protein
MLRVARLGGERAMEPCNELCTKEATGTCALCDKLAERDQFIRRWFKGGLFSEIHNAVAPSYKKGLRWLRAHGLLAFLVIGSPLFIFFFSRALWIQSNRRISCPWEDTSAQSFYGYLQIQLREQHPIEPTFKGQLFFQSFDPIGAGRDKVTAMVSGGGTYAPSRYTIETIWNEKVKDLQPGDDKEIGLSAGTRHESFPFDSARFDFEVSLDPPLNFSHILINNRVPGFVIPCSELHVDRLNTGHFHIKFGLDRSPFIELYVVALTIASVVFLILILQINQLTTLATSIASFFLALWSLRRIFDPQIKTFPTLFDHGILSICMLALFCLLWKVYRLKRLESGV